MRNFTLCTVLFAIVLVLTQFAYAQSADYTEFNVVYEQIQYHDYHYGVVVDSTGSVPGVLLRDVNGVGIPMPGEKLIFVGGDDFGVVVETDENGQFKFDQAEVGTYTVIYENDDILSSLDVKVTAYAPDVSSLYPDTGISNSRMILVLEENNMLRFAATNGTSILPLAPVGAAATPVSGQVATGVAGAAGGGILGGGGQFGMLAGALGVAGLVTGAVALGNNNNNRQGDNGFIPPPPPASVGATTRPGQGR